VAEMVSSSNHTTALGEVVAGKRSVLPSPGTGTRSAAGCVRAPPQRDGGGGTRNIMRSQLLKVQPILIRIRRLIGQSVEG